MTQQPTREPVTDPEGRRPIGVPPALPEPEPEPELASTSGLTSSRLHTVPDLKRSVRRAVDVGVSFCRLAFRRVFVEMLIATLVSVAVAAAVGWRVLTAGPATVPGVGTDPFIELWSLAWSGHALRPGSGVPLSQLFDGNAFYPDRYSLAFTDSLLGFGPFTWFFHGAAGLVLVYNLIMVFGPALASLGGYALARQLGANQIGAAVAGFGFAYAPWRTGQFSHLHVLAIGPLVVALALLARGHGLTMSGRPARPRPLWVLPGWLFAAWQMTIGFAGGLPFGYLLGVISLVVLLVLPVRLVREYLVVRSGSAPRAAARIRARRRKLRLLVPLDLLGGAIFAVAAALMARPYLRVQELDPLAVLRARNLAVVARYSPTPRDLLNPPSVPGTWSWLTSGQTLVSGTDEIRMLPGAILLVLAVLGLLLSSWTWRWRLTLLVSAQLIACLAVGTTFPDRLFPGPDSPYALLWKHAPGWAADRTPGRLMAFDTLAIALLAAGGVTKLCQLAVGVRRALVRWPLLVAVAVMPVLVVVEGWVTIPTIPVPPMPRAVAQAQGPMVVLPSLWWHDSRVMFWTANRGFPAVSNGASGFTPSSLTRMRSEMYRFPDQRSMAYLRVNGIRSVVVLSGPLGTKLWRNAGAVPDPKWGLIRTDDGTSVLFTVGPQPPVKGPVKREPRDGGN